MSELIVPHDRGEDEDPNRHGSTEEVKIMFWGVRAEADKAKRSLVSKILLWNSEVDGCLQQCRNAREAVIRMRLLFDPENAIDVLRLRIWDIASRCDRSVQNMSQVLKLLEADWQAKNWCGRYELWMDFKIEVAREETQSLTDKLSKLEDLNLINANNELEQYLGAWIHALATSFDRAWALAKEIVFWAN